MSQSNVKILWGIKEFVDSEGILAEVVQTEGQKYAQFDFPVSIYSDRWKVSFKRNKKGIF